MEKIHSFENSPDEEKKIKELELLADKVFDKIENWDDSEVYIFLTKLQEKYPDHADYRLYHLLDSSSLFKSCSKFDFPGDDSIEKFLRAHA
jgi:hypothetical protein